MQPNHRASFGQARHACARSTGLVASVAVALLVAGCGISGIDGIELQGGVFDALGMSGSGPKKTVDAKVPARPGLVIPPSNYQLPDPNNPQVATAQSVAGGQAWPVGPEQRTAMEKADLDRRHKEFCDKAIQQAEVSADAEAETIMGPKGRCRPGLFGAATNIYTPPKQQQ